MWPQGGALYARNTATPLVCTRRKPEEEHKQNAAKKTKLQNLNSGLDQLREGLERKKKRSLTATRKKEGELWTES